MMTKRMKEKKTSGGRYRVGGRYHGLRNCPEYSSWDNMIGRCERPSHASFKHYGAKGIKVCAAWRASFMAFYDYVGPKPTPLHTIECINNRKGYQPDNVVWATREEQSNNLSCNRMMAFNGLTLSPKCWADRLGLNLSTIYNRINQGKSVVECLSPINPKYRNRNAN